MAQEEFNLKDRSRDTKMRRGVIYLFCTMIIILTILLDTYFISELLA